MTPLRRSITLKISLLVMGSTLVVLALVVELMYTSSRELIRQEAENRARNLVSAMAGKIEQEFMIVAKAADQLVFFLETTNWLGEMLPNEIRAAVKRNPEVYGSAVAFLPFEYDPAIERYAPYVYKAADKLEFVQLATQPYDYLEKDWFRVPVSTRKAVWAEPYFHEGGETIAVTTYSRPMFSRETENSPPKLRGIVTADITLERLNRVVNEKRVYDTGFCSVFSKKGMFVTHRTPDRVMRDSIFDVADERNHPRAKEYAQKMLAEESGFFDIGHGFTGVDSYLAFTRIDPPGWTLAAIIPKNELFAEVDLLKHKTRIFASLGVGLLVVAAVLVARSISRPLRRMASETVKVAEGNFDIDLSSIKSRDEVGQLARSFTRMTEGLKDRERIKDTFGRYLTQEVVKRLLETRDGLKLGGEIREISIMMSDLRGFTALSSSMSPEQVIKFLNRYLGKMVDIILDHRGIIDEIIGDGVLAFFGAPESLNNHPELAVACALKMQLAMEGINALNEADGLPHLEMGIAVNTGDVVVGNIGSEKRAKYGAVGAQVNFTGRAESFTVGGQVLISKNTYEKLSGQVDIGSVLPVEMKGVPGEVLLYDVRAIRGEYGARLEHVDDSLTRLATGIAVRVFRMEQKILESSGKTGTIIEASLKSARLISESEIMQWEDLRIVITGTELDAQGSEIYGKVMNVIRRDDGIESLIRFTSVSPGAYRLLRQSISI